MKALTICQPYADMIATGEKIIENRTWPTSYRGPLAIHAGKSRDWLDESDWTERPHMVFGAIIAVAVLSDCQRVETLPNEMQRRSDADGPWCWILTDVEPIAPVAVNGSQGLWEWQRAAFEATKAETP